VAESLYERALATIGPVALKAHLQSVSVDEYMDDPPEGADGLTAYEALDFLWELMARPEQLMPEGDHWDTALFRAGRGWGKTRVGSQATIEVAEEAARLVEAGKLAPEEAKIHLVGATAADVRDVMIRGPAGILRCSPPWFPARYEPSNRRIVWPGGVEAILFSAEEPDRLRGPQCIFAWADELAAWKYVDEAWDMLQLGLRLGPNPRGLVTTTPRPIKIIKDLMADPRTIVRKGETKDNAKNLSPKAVAKLYAKYGGTRIGRQELSGEVLDDNPNALWKQSEIDAHRLRPPAGWRSPDDSGWSEDDKPDFAKLLRVLALRAKATLSILEAHRIELERIMIGGDPAVSNNPNSDEFGMVCFGIGMCRCKGGNPERHGFVLEDVSGVYSPAEWGKLLVRLYAVWKANKIIAEINQGGALVESNLRATEGGQNLPYKGINVKKGKLIRAEPVATLSEQGMIHFVGSFPKLETELTTWDPQDQSAKSPNRLDAMVFPATELMIEGGVASFAGIPQITSSFRRD